jgi:hypothetical protein
LYDNMGETAFLNAYPFGHSREPNSSEKKMKGRQSRFCTENATI